jgi:hypothetical protein
MYEFLVNGLVNNEGHKGFLYLFRSTADWSSVNVLNWNHLIGMGVSWDYCEINSYLKNEKNGRKEQKGKGKKK